MKKHDLKFIIPSVVAIILAALLVATLAKNPESKKIEKKPQQTPSVIAEKATAPTFEPENQNLQTEKVLRVIDGDTIELVNGQKVRYIGIDTPETVDPRKYVGCFGLESSQKNKELVQGKTVRLEKDVSDTDKYGRLLRYVYLLSESTGSDQIFVNDYLVRQGFAYASTYPPDVKYQDQFANAQQEATSKNLGLWSTCQNFSPDQNQNQTQAQNDDCKVKGNISSSGEKIYHVPGQRYYDKTVIDEPKGERWFCSEVEAQEAGWRKSKI